MHRTFLLISLFCVATASLAGTDGILEGIVRNKKTGEPLVGVNVAVVSLQRGAVTDTNGYFIIPHLRAGRYGVRFTHIGFTSVLTTDVVVSPDLRTRLQIDLEPTDVQLEEITVVQERPLIQRDVTSTTYVLEGRDLTLLPVTNVLDAVRYKPGITAEGNVRGGKSTEVLYLVDGLPVQDLIAGGRGTTLPNSSVTGMSIYTGGFEAQYGNALSGVVNIVTNSGTDDHRTFIRADADNLAGGTQVSKERQFEAAASGPLVRENAYYTVSLNGVWTGTRWWQDLQYFYSGLTDRSLSGFGKIDVRFTPTLRLGTQFLIYDHAWKDYEFSWRYNLDGLPPEQRTSYRLAAILSHVIAENFSYTASLSRLFLRSRIGTRTKEEVAAMPPYQYDFFLRYIVDGNRAWRTVTDQATHTLKADATLKVGQVHFLKFGGELNLYTVSADIIKYEPRKTYFGKPLVNEPQLNFSTAYTYRPTSGSLYVQSKTDVPSEGALLTAGLRYDFLNPTAARPNIAAIPVSDTGYVFTTTASVPAKLKHQVSPRFGVALQVTDKGYLYVNLGWYFQYPLFSYLYSGLDKVSLGRGVSALTGNPDLNPERSKVIELSFKYILPQNLVGSVTYFKKESTDLIDTKTFVPGDSKLAGSYGFAEYVNNPYANATGVELVLSRERGEWITGEISYAFMKAEGVSGSSTDGFYIAQYGLPPGKRAFPLSWDQRHTIKALVTLTVPGGWRMSSAVDWHSGRPYTQYPTSTGFEKIDGGRFYQNNERMPAYGNWDLRVEKTFQLGITEASNFVLYLDVRNLLNARNVQWIDSNGRIGGELGDPSGYFTGRRTYVGLRAEL